jgi:hypothetical protein
MRHLIPIPITEESPLRAPTQRLGSHVHTRGECLKAVLSGRSDHSLNFQLSCCPLKPKTYVFANLAACRHLPLIIGPPHSSNPRWALSFTKFSLLSHNSHLHSLVTLLFVPHDETLISQFNAKAPSRRHPLRTMESSSDDDAPLLNSKMNGGECLLKLAASLSLAIVFQAVSLIKKFTHILT